MRKIVQIATSEAGLFALCDDGTVWIGRYEFWEPIKPIPQPPDPREL